MTKKDVQKFDKLIQKTFNGDEDTFEMIMDVFANLMVQENLVSNQELMDKIQRYTKSEQQINSFLTAYFEFANKIILELDRLQMIANEQEYQKEFKKFIKNILMIVPKNELQDTLYTAMYDLFDIINDEYEISSIPFDDNFANSLERVFDGVTPMMELYVTVGKLLVKDDENPNQKISLDELYQQAEIMFSFVQFANITRMRIALQTEQTSMQPVNQASYNNQKKPTKIYQLKISIKGAKPPIWRRVLVQSDITFYDLHKIIQSIFNWEDYHLYQFYGARRYTDVQTAQEDMGYEDEVDAAQYQISQELKYAKDKIKYIYDFGDDWEHEIVLEKVLKFDEEINYPICTGGRRNGPPEDCGGIWGYSDILYALETKNFDEFEYLVDDEGDFYYKDFDPAYFDKDAINERLRQ